ncbi:hypothetical protein Slin15195_G032810 [Septoria linicola]|uniref:Uncharacterized protein n=1 Tax=Septoria linicola TaxID=215465 RepID=A0A9Q9AQ05_9PEZI|nr:hypothetical protein Slin14017_G031840 [Septoria linicola]USW49962.1 hypothetical protein Slin15195_G032810 [Septoria linicola]
MAAPVAKGIILSITLIAGLAGLAAQNPQVQAWLEEQRKKIAELLRQIGEELDPQSRRAAEAFAFEGRTVSNDAGLAREAEGSKEAAALATGRRLSSPSTTRRIPIRGPSDPDEAAERRRKGREYLAQRNQKLYELQQKRKAAARVDGLETPPAPTFDEMVDSEGNLKHSGMLGDKDLPEVPSKDPLPEAVHTDMEQVERHLAQPIPTYESTNAESSGWSWGSRYANPFGDEYELERSITPKPPAVPPKIQLESQMDNSENDFRAPTPPISVPGAFETSPTVEPTEQVDHSALSYEEQLAIALSLSEQDSPGSPAQARRNDADAGDHELNAAIAASLKDMDMEATHIIPEDVATTPKLGPSDGQTLGSHSNISYLSDAGAVEASRGLGRLSSWPAIHPEAPRNRPSSVMSDELYRLTPRLTKARLTSHTEQQNHAISQSPSGSSLPFDPVRDAAAAMDTSFYSAHAEPSPAPTSATLDRETHLLVDYSEDAPQEGQRTPISRAHSSFGFQTDSDSDTFASLSAALSRTASRASTRAESERSGIQVIDLMEDSDVDMLSEEGDGIATPDSWSEVGSRDGDSEDDRPQQQR